MVKFTDASSIHNISMAVHSVAAFGMAMSAQAANTAPTRKYGPPPAETRPGAVRVVADQRLDDQSGDGAGQPQQRNAIETGAEILEDARGIGLRQRESELDAERAQADLADLPGGEMGLRKHMRC